MKVSPRILSVLALGLFASQIEAQVIAVQGSTKGCFYQAPAITCTPTATATDLFLTFTQGTFNGFTDATGFFAMNTALNNFGSFSLGGGGATYTGQNFLLQVLFTLPTVPNPGAVFTASLIGTVVSPTVGGGADILFNNAPQPVPFVGSDKSGILTVNVYDVYMNQGTTVEADGFIHTSVAPEPGTTALVATGLMGLIPVVRIKRRKSQDV
jgi:hypothetical protein